MLFADKFDLTRPPMQRAPPEINATAEADPLSLACSAAELEEARALRKKGGIDSRARAEGRWRAKKRGGRSRKRSGG
jgi:hypothetical protein